MDLKELSLILTNSKMHIDITMISASYRTIPNFYSHSFRHMHPTSGYAFAHTWQEEHNIHDEPYGYEFGEDVFVMLLTSHLAL